MLACHSDARWACSKPRGFDDRTMRHWILWDFKRGTWQYDFFCLLIIAFIFLTPKSWFERAEKLATQTAASIVRIQSAPDTSNN